MLAICMGTTRPSTRMMSRFPPSSAATVFSRSAVRGAYLLRSFTTAAHLLEPIACSSASLADRRHGPLVARRRRGRLRADLAACSAAPSGGHGNGWDKAALRSSRDRWARNGQGAAKQSNAAMITLAHLGDGHLGSGARARQSHLHVQHLIERRASDWQRAETGKQVCTGGKGRAKATRHRASSGPSRREGALRAVLFGGQKGFRLGALVERSGHARRRSLRPLLLRQPA